MLSAPLRCRILVTACRHYALALQARVRRPIIASLLLPTAILLTGCQPQDGQTEAVAMVPAIAPEALWGEYCQSCHNDDDYSGGLSFDLMSSADIAAGVGMEEWERVLHMTRLGDMPPPDEPRPDPHQMAQFTSWLETSLDAYAALHPDPGRATLRRLNRQEYTNAIRDLLALDIDISTELPTDDAGYGFDNIAELLSVSPLLMERYLSVAGKLSRLAVGLGPDYPSLTSYTVPKDGSILNQGIPAYDERASDQLPLDSRGGGVFTYFAPQDGTYVVSGYLNANTNNEADRLPEDKVSLRVPLRAGAHQIGLAFRKQLLLDESVQTLHNDVDYVVLPTEEPQMLTLDYLVDGRRVGTTEVPSYHMRARFSQANWPRDVLQIDVEGPFDVSGPGDTASRRRIFTCTPEDNASSGPTADEGCAREILSSLAKQAYRRSVTDADLNPLMAIYAGERAETDFTNAVAVAIQAMLVSPKFLFLIEQNPAGAEPGSVHPVSDVELASRLALFLWSSLPDAELIALAEQQQLRQPDVLTAQIDRMLEDPRSEEFVRNFAGQWLYLRNLDEHVADIVLYSDFDKRLRSAMQRETELFFGSILRENRSVLEFIDADYSFLNEQLAQHYGIEGVKGTAFRRVTLDASSGRGGLLGQASLLTVTSYANKTSVVKRGQWILENLLDASPPPPPPNVEGLVTSVEGRQLSPREQMQRHRENPSCHTCHVKMDELGFALEQYDAIGKFRTEADGLPVEPSASLPGIGAFTGLDGLRGALLQQQDQFVRTLTGKLLTYATGRGMEAHDQPVIRSIARAAQNDDYRMQNIIYGIVTSDAFTLRRTPE